MPIEQGPIPVEEDAPLWRYVSLSTFLQYLSGRVFVPSIKKLRECDPCEGVRVGNVDLAWVTNAFSNEEYGVLCKWVCENRLSKADQECWDYNAKQERSWPARPGNQIVAVRHLEAEIAETRYAWCWFDSVSESAGMWQVYGKNGVAVRSSLRKLRPVLEGQATPWLVSKMKYLNHFQHRASREMYPFYRKPFLVKRLEYKHEQEVRFVTISGKKRPGIVLENLTPNEWIEEILFWPALSESEAYGLRDAVQRVQTICGCELVCPSCLTGTGVTPRSKRN